MFDAADFLLGKPLQKFRTMCHEYDLPEEELLELMVKIVWDVHRDPNKQKYITNLIRKPVL